MAASEPTGGTWLLQRLRRALLMVLALTGWWSGFAKWWTRAATRPISLSKQQICLIPAFHTLGDDFHAQGVGNLYHRSHHRRARDVFTQALDQRPVYLDGVGGASLVAETVISRRLAATRWRISMCVVGNCAGQVSEGTNT